MTTDLADKIAMYVGGGLIVLGIAVMGFINLLARGESAMTVYEVTQGGATTTGHALSPAMAPAGATIVHVPLFDPNLRAYIVALGLLVFGLYAVYRVFVHAVRQPDRRVAPVGVE